MLSTCCGPNCISRFISHCAIFNLGFSESDILDLLPVRPEPAYICVILLASCLSLWNRFSSLTDAQTVHCQLATGTLPDLGKLHSSFSIFLYISLSFLKTPMFHWNPFNDITSFCYLYNFVLSLSLPLVCQILEAGVKTSSLTGPKHWAWRRVGIARPDTVIWLRDWGVILLTTLSASVHIKFWAHSRIRFCTT